MCQIEPVEQKTATSQTLHEEQKHYQFNKFDRSPNNSHNYPEQRVEQLEYEEPHTFNILTTHFDENLNQQFAKEVMNHYLLEDSSAGNEMKLRKYTPEPLVTFN